MIKASRTSECISGAHLGDRSIYRKYDELCSHYIDDLLPYALSYWDFFILLILLLTLGARTRVTVVVLCVCVSVTELAAIYLDYTMKVRCH